MGSPLGTGGAHLGGPERALCPHLTVVQGRPLTWGFLGLRAEYDALLSSGLRPMEHLGVRPAEEAHLGLGPGSGHRGRAFAGPLSKVVARDVPETLSSFLLPFLA